MGLTYALEFTDLAVEHIQQWKKEGNLSAQRKISALLRELQEHPAEGTGQVEQLRFDLAGFWSRRINKEHRLLYRIDEENKVVTIVRLKGHY